MLVLVTWLVVAPLHNTAGTANGFTDGKVKTHFSTDRPENINDIFSTMKPGAIDGRVVLEF
jgi:D-arabinose 1-dehydrogenase-like Zn-dependent alcohol dehydrogenase